MALERRHCARCGYAHYQDDELWFSLDELIEVVRMTVQACLAMPDQRLPAAERDQIRARIAAGRRPGPATGEVTPSPAARPGGQPATTGEGRPRYRPA